MFMNIQSHCFFGTNMQLQNEIHLQPTLCSAATLTRQGCSPKSWGGVTLKPWEVGHHPNLDEARLQLR